MRLDLLQIEQHMVALLQTDADGSLYLMLQLAASSNVGYSASHALVCASLCHLVASDMLDEIGQPENARTWIEAALARGRGLI